MSDSFEEWWNYALGQSGTTELDKKYVLVRELAQAAYAAGMERAAVIADEAYHYENGVYVCPWTPTAIAAAIREEMK